MSEIVIGRQCTLLCPGTERTREHGSKNSELQTVNDVNLAEDWNLDEATDSIQKQPLFVYKNFLGENSNNMTDTRYVCYQINVVEKK